MFCPLTATMHFLPPPPSEGICYKIGTRHGTAVSLGSLELSQHKQLNAPNVAAVV